MDRGEKNAHDFWVVHVVHLLSFFSLSPIVHIFSIPQSIVARFSFCRGKSLAAKEMLQHIASFLSLRVVLMCEDKKKNFKRGRHGSQKYCVKVSRNWPEAAAFSQP